MVTAISALLLGAVSTKDDLKSGPKASIALKVSARLKLPCIPCPSCRVESATSTRVKSERESKEKLLKFTTKAGFGNCVMPIRPIALSGSVPGIAPRSSLAKTPST